MVTGTEVKLLQAFFDERLALAAVAVDPASTAGIAISQCRDALPEVFAVFEKAVDVAVMVQDALAVIEEHVP